MKLRWTLLVIALFSGGDALARDNTYCVGGYTGTPLHIAAACDTPEVRAMHGRWHEHMFLRGPGGCAVCYDERDNTCETAFQRTHPEYSDADPLDCALIGPEGDSVLAHVIDGVSQATPPPPPARLRAGLEDVTPGPYTTGDAITARGTVRDQDGHLRPITGGTFALTDDAGHVQTVRGAVQADGAVLGHLPIPASAGVKVVFTPDPPRLAPGDTLVASASDPLQVGVSVCAYTAAVVAPTPGASLVSGQAVPLRATLTDARTGAPLGPPPGAALAFTLAPADGASTEIPASADGAGFTASWTPPASPDPKQFTLYAAGKAGDRVICHAPAGMSVSASDLGLGYDLSGLPDTCYATLPCQGTLRLVRPDPGPGRAAVDALLADPATQVVLLSGGDALATLPPDPSDHYRFNTVYTTAHNASWSLEIRRPAGTVSSPAHEVRVRLALVLRLPAEIDFGAVPAGTALFDACQKLDFSRSQAAGDHRWQLSLEGLGDCEARPELAFTNTAGAPDAVPISPDHPVEALDPAHPWLDLCLRVPRCAGEQSPPQATLRVTPLTPEFASQAATVRLKWRVTQRSWLACQGAWLWPSLLGLTGLFLLVGWIRPRRFRPEAAIAVAGSERGLRTAPWTALLDCPGSSPGFYRDARLGLHADGAINGRTRDALLVLRASDCGAVIDPTGLVEVQDRRTLKWTAVEERGHPPTRGAIYRAGGTYFRVESGLR